MVDPIVGELVEVSDDGSQPAEFSLVWSAPSAVVSPGSGVITNADSIVVGSVEELIGTVVVEIDGIDRIGSNYPFYRAIHWGDEGPDVLALNWFLAGLGFDTDLSADRFNEATSRAVRDFRQTIGADSSTMFDPAFLVFLPEDGNVERWASTYGAQISAGDDLLVLEPQLSVVSVSLSAAPQRQSLLRGSSAIEVATNDKVLTLPNLDLDQASVSLFSEIVEPGTETVGAQLRLVEPVVGVAIPSSALTIATDGQTTCLWSASGGDPEPISVATRASVQPGTRIGDADLIGLKVVLNADQIPNLAEAPC